MKTERNRFRSRFWLAVALWAVAGTSGSAVEKPAPPTHVRGERQDFQAARITWQAVEGKNVKYFLYASYDRKPFDFHKENDAKPISDTLVSWDAPRNGLRRFVFYVTTVDPQGRESQPSKQVRVDLGPLPQSLRQ